MFNITVNGKRDFEINLQQDKFFVNGLEVDLDVAMGGAGHQHILYKNKSYRTEIVSVNREEKTCTVKVNGRNYHLKLSDQYDQLLHRLGLDTLSHQKAADLKAPMPGLVLSVLVAEGDHVKKGDSILVLEAMKMENIIKSPGDLKLKKIMVKPADKIEKNQIMVIFE